MKKFIAMLLVLTMMACCFAACDSAPTADQATPTGNAGEATGEATGEAADDTTAADGSETDLAYVQANGTLVVGITEYEPMDYKDENGEWTGFDAELARMFAKELGVECEFFVLADWGKKFMELDANTEEAKANATVSDPYVINAQVVVMKADKLASYPDTDSMMDLVFAVEEGSAGQEVAENVGLKTVSKQDQAGALMEVAAGAADACVIDITMANAMTGEGTDYAELGVGISLSSEEYGVAFRTGSELAEKFNAFLEAKKADGSLQALADKYQLTLAE